MAEIKPVPFREVQPRTSFRGGAAGAAEGVADVLGALANYGNKKIVRSYAEHLDSTISELNTDDLDDEIIGEVSPNPVVMRFMEKAQKLKHAVNVGTKDQVSNARMVAKREFNKAALQFPHLKPVFAQATEGVLNLSADLEAMKLEDAFQRQQFQQSTNELNYLERRGHEMGVPATMVVGTREWGDLYAELDHKHSQAQIAELELKLAAADDKADSENIEQLLYSSFNQSYGLEFNKITSQLTEWRNISRKAARGGKLTQEEYDFNTEMMGGLKQELIQGLTTLVIEAQDVVPSMFTAERMGSESAKRATAYIDAKIQGAKDLITAINKDDTDAVATLQMRQEAGSRMLVEDNPALRDAITVAGTLGGPEGLRYLSQVKGFENIDMMDKLGQRFAKGLEEAMSTVSKVAADGKPNPDDTTGASYTERVDSNLPPRSQRNGTKRRIETVSQDFQNAGVLLYTDEQGSMTEQTLNTMAGNVGVMARDRYNTQETYDSVANTLSDSDFIARLDELRKKPKMHRALGNLGINLQNYILSVVYPEAGYGARNAQYSSILDRTIGLSNTSGTTYVILRDAIKLDEDVLLEDNKIKFRVNEEVAKQVPSAQRDIATAIYDLNTQLNKDINLYYQTEKMLRPDEDIQIEALLYRMGFAEVLFGNTDQ